VALAYETVVGMEVHVQLSTATKLFCGCPNSFGDEPNTNVCPVCLGQPGVLPVVNREVVERAMRASFALGCDVAPRTKFDRKSYYYPDLPKNYQISQYDEPIGANGVLDFDVDGTRRRARIRRVHMEEDAGKLVHGGGASSLVDLNRTGVPLIEIVSEPDLHSGAEARAYLEELRRVLCYLGVSACTMEEGSMRCEPNISIRPQGSTDLGTKTEVKNLNSFKAVEAAVEYEARRQAQLLDASQPVRQETMLWDDERGQTRPMRSKEEAHDYRYFPEPDLPPIEISEAWRAAARASVGELPSARRARYEREFGLSAYDVGVLAAEKDVSDFFEEVVAAGVDAKSAANWVTQDLLRAVSERGCSIRDCNVTPAAIAALERLKLAGTIDNTIARQAVFPAMVRTGRAPAEIVEAEGLAMVSDASELERIANKVVDENPKPLADIRKNPNAAMKYIGLIRTATGGRADARVVREILKKIVKERAGVDL
jgi:aspartyl-tRNA(Asn)/glutamyl-tRNA(Gln) amidotransferase subunit B